MALEIVWSKRADLKFDRILEYLSKEFGNQVTQDFVRKTYDFLDILREFPDIGTIEHRVKRIRGFVIIKNVSLFYIVRGEKIIILNLFDNRQNPIRKRF